jgi:hypothetical protein
MRRTNRIPLAVTILLLAALACNLPQPTPPPSEGPNAAYTAAAQTVAVALTQSAQNQVPTATNTQAGAPPPPVFTSTNTNAPPTIAPLNTNTPFPTTTQQCDKAEFVKDVTIPDGTVVPAGSAFTKTWRIKNIGTCTWTPAYTVVYDHGNQMGGPNAQALGVTVSAGQTVDIAVNLVAPTTANEYTGYWKLRNASGVTFTQFYANIKVQAASTFAVTSVTYTLSTWSDAGHTNCPRVVAHITTNGPGTVTFKWTRMDTPGGGATQSINFAAADTKNVRNDWARGSTWAGTPTWVGIIIVTPNNQNFGHINFTNACTTP